MNFLIDQNLPAAKELFAAHGELHFFEGRELLAELLAEAEVLLIRSVTRIDAEVIAKAPKLKFVGTATIGTDHMDLPALDQSGITHANAAGCNAIAVGEYVLSAALAVAQKHGLRWHGKHALIVGAGNTGVEAGKRLAALGMHVSYIDPIQQELGSQLRFTSWEHLREFDLISFHVPMEYSGPLATWHLMDAERIERLKPGATLINASRGAVVDNRALYRRLNLSNDLHVVFDVWEGEPEVIVELVPLVDFATPHIAGHSIEGKIRGTYHLYTQLYKLFKFAGPLLPENSVLPGFTGEPITIPDRFDETDIVQWVHRVYPIDQDDSDFRQDGLTAAGFDRLRKEYALRRELWSQVLLCSPENISKQQKQLTELGFTVREE